MAEPVNTFKPKPVYEVTLGKPGNDYYKTYYVVANNYGHAEERVQHLLEEGMYITTITRNNESKFLRD